MDLPAEVDEAAAVDGASKSRASWQIILPMCRPIIVSTVLLNILFTWNEYLFAMIFTSGGALQTLPVGLTNLMSKYGTDYPVVFAGMAIAALPVSVLPAKVFGRSTAFRCSSDSELLSYIKLLPGSQNRILSPTSEDQFTARAGLSG